MKPKKNKKTIKFPPCTADNVIAGLLLANGDVLPLKVTKPSKKIKPKFKAVALKIRED